MWVITKRFFAPNSALQESPEVVPTGEMPRNIIVVLDRNLVDKVSPGTRVSIMGIASLYNSAAAKKQVGGVAIRTPFIQVGVFLFCFLVLFVRLWRKTKGYGQHNTCTFECFRNMFCPPIDGCPLHIKNIFYSHEKSCRKGSSRCIQYSQLTEGCIIPPIARSKKNTRSLAGIQKPASLKFLWRSREDLCGL